MGRAIPASIIRFMIGADRIIGADPKALQSTAKDMRKSGSGRDETAKRSLGACARGVNQYAAAVESPPPLGPDKA